MRQADRACELEPETGYILNTLGVAQYRIGQYDEAVKTLTRSDEINSNSKRPPGGSDPTDIAFLAMAHHRLGHNEEARKLLDQLRQLLREVRWKNHVESQGFLQEAMSLFEQ